MPVIHVKSESEWRSKINGPTPAVVDFTAAWCGPCKMIAPIFDALSEEFTQILFLKVDVDELEGVAKEAGISAMPTFQIYHNGKKVKQVVGGNPGGLKSLINEAVQLVGPPAVGRVLGGDATLSGDDQASARERMAAAAEARLKAAAQ